MNSFIKYSMICFGLYLFVYVILSMNGRYVRSGFIGYVWEPYAIEWHSTLAEDGMRSESHWNALGYFYFPLLYNDRFMWHRDRRSLWYAMHHQSMDN